MKEEMTNNNAIYADFQHDVKVCQYHIATRYNTVTAVPSKLHIKAPICLKYL